MTLSKLIAELLRAQSRVVQDPEVRMGYYLRGGKEITYVRQNVLSGDVYLGSLEEESQLEAALSKDHEPDKDSSLGRGA